MLTDAEFRTFMNQLIGSLSVEQYEKVFHHLYERFRYNPPPNTPNYREIAWRLKQAKMLIGHRPKPNQNP
jgi:hypothetical protein